MLSEKMACTSSRCSLDKRTPCDSVIQFPPATFQQQNKMGMIVECFKLSFSSFVFF